jgi:hypothetical protein
VNANFKLDISIPYTEIIKGYKRNCSRNIKKAKQADFTIGYELEADEFVRFIQANLEEQIKDVGHQAYGTLETLVLKCVEKGKADLVALYAENKLQAAGFFLKNNDRYIFSVCASTDFGKQNQAMSLLVDSQIERNAEKYKWFDFSGSNIKGIAYFNSTFGSVKTRYKTISINQLPKWTNIVRR